MSSPGRATPPSGFGAGSTFRATCSGMRAGLEDFAPASLLDWAHMGLLEPISAS